MSSNIFVFADLIIGIAMFSIINALGAKGLPLTYQSFINAFDEEKSIFNVGYRVFAPIVLLMLITLAGKILTPNTDPFLAFYSIVFYWGLRFIAWVFHRKELQTNFLMFLSQAGLSILLCLYLFNTAMQDPIENLLPQSSDISLEFVVIVLFVVLQMLSQSPVFRKEDYYWQLCEKCEKELYEFERKYSHLFPERVKQDVALRTLLYTIALTENHYRPKSHRRIERILAKLGLQRFGLAKTTGIMQVTSDKTLSDEESVVLAIPIIEEIYNRYLTTSNRFSLKFDSYYSQSAVDFVMFYQLGYTYNLKYMIESIEYDIDSIYGKYSGSSLSNPRLFYTCARNFIFYKEYEQGYGNVEVSYPIETLFSGIPAGPWCRIERSQGFAVCAELQDVSVLYTESQIVISEIAEDLKQSELSSEILLLANRLGRTTLVLRNASAHGALLEQIKVKYDFNLLDQKNFDFNALCANPIGYLDELVSPIPVAKG